MDENKDTIDTICYFCKKKFTTKRNCLNHLNICKIKKQQDYDSSQKIIDDLQNRIKFIEKQLIEKDKLLEQKDEEIRIQKNIIDRYVKNDDKISNQINTTNNTQNNITINTTQPLKDIISSLQPINF